ncbi:MAG: hypothetical protein ACLFUL_14610 [Desulfobacteraceae bacterium]
MIEILKDFARRTDTESVIDRALIGGADPGQLLDFVVRLHGRTVDTAKSLFVDRLIQRRVAERFQQHVEDLRKEIEALEAKVPNDPKRLQLAVELTINLARKRIEEQIRRECAMDIAGILDDFRY